jgi:hypothetical protein
MSCIANFVFERTQISPLDATIERFRTLTTKRFAWCIAVMSRSSDAQMSALKRTTALIRAVCALAGCVTLIDDARVFLAGAGVFDAVRDHDDGVLFEWLMEVLSYQGVSDAIAYGYMEKHGRIGAAEVSRGLKRKGVCPKLQSYWAFQDCGFQKSKGTCAEPQYVERCALPRHPMRNGRLNQSAYHLHLFCRDVAEGDLVDWLDRRLAQADSPKARDRSERMAAAVVEPLTHVFGISDKVLSMSLSMLLLAGDPERERWQAAGASMIAIDTLVHNWLHRTGTLKRHKAAHLYGPNCYGPDGCAAIIRSVSARIDARRFNPEFPRNFPRFVQNAIWQFCSQEGLDQCNGNRIDDRERCDLDGCALYGECSRIKLHRPKPLEPAI